MGYVPILFKYLGGNMNIDYMLNSNKPDINVVVAHKLNTLEAMQKFSSITLERHSDDGLAGPYVSQSVFLYEVVSKTNTSKETIEFEFILSFLKANPSFTHKRAGSQFRNPTSDKIYKRAFQI